MIFIGTARRFLLIKGSHKWNAWVRDWTAMLESTWLISDLPWAARKNRAQENFWFWLAWHLPKTLVHFAGIRLWSNATTGKYSHIEVPAVKMDEALKRWKENNNE